DEGTLGRLEAERPGVVALRLLLLARLEVHPGPVAMQERDPGRAADGLVELLDGLAPSSLGREDARQVRVGLILLGLPRDGATEVIRCLREFPPADPHGTPIDEDA